ncbi:MAG: MFS transporter [Pedobacter sp.]|jgi:ACS family hexuronate transporter-like MFS transporter
MIRTSGRTTGFYRWKICAMLFLATTINFVDRQVLGILAPQLQKEFSWSDSEYGFIVSSFQAAYAIGFLFMGHLLDKIGTRMGAMIAIGFWSIATMLHSIVGSLFGFAAVRFLLGLGEAGNFPSAMKAVSEWFPRKERALATGIFVSGASVGAIVAPLTVPFIAIHYGWQMTFVITGAIGFVWIAFWMWMYRSPQEHPRLSVAELEYISSDPPETPIKISWVQLLKYRQTWAFAFGAFMTHPIFSFFLFFLPKFFYSNYDIGIDKIGPILIIIYLMSDLGSIVGGWASSALIKIGWTINKSRKTTMLASALCVVPVYFAAQTTELWVSVGLIGLALAAHSAWSTNLFTLTTDMFPRQVVGSVVGIGSMLGAVGGMFGASIGGFLLQTTGSYVSLFLFAGCAYLIAFTGVQLLAPKLKSITLEKIL